MLEALGTQRVQEIHRGRRYVVLRGWRQDGEPLVIKTVRAGPLAEGSRTMLHHEYAMLRSLHGEVPGVARPVALEEDSAKRPALLLEDAGPQNLQEWLKRRPVGMDAFLELAIQLAGIIASLHQQHVIHRDINPTNMIVSAGSRHLTVVDFDLSTTVAGLAPTSDLPGELQWALPYIAPEQTGRMDRPIDHRADLYSLGATFYELLTGLPPFVSTDPAELVHAHLAKPPVPPAFANPAVPKLLSNLVMKLLAKMPEQRYQSAEALLADILEARRRHASGSLGSFELGRLDLARQLSLPERLYGREREREKLRDALERVRHGPSEVMLLAGPAGIGKSTLVQELGRKATAPGDHVLTGKFNQLQGNTPYAPFVEAFQCLLGKLLAEPEEVRDAWKRRLLAALGLNARVIIDVVPQLESLLGEQPPPPKLEPVEAAARFHLVFQAFVQGLASEGHALVLFLDDLQWADPGSLQLLKRLVTDPDSRHVLFVGAYRPEEVTPGHPFTATLAAIGDAAVLALNTLELSPLDLPALTALCSDTFRRSPEEARPLADLVQRKTAGNPLFVTRFLRFLHQSSLLSFDLEHGTWDWDLDRIEQAEVTENVVELMMASIRRLPARAQRILKVAACLGDRVELWLLSALVGTTSGEVASALWSVLREGLLVPERDGVRAARPDGVSAGEPPPQEATYRFAHDRVRQAAYSLLSEAERAQLHCAAGRLLLHNAPRDALGDRLFTAVDHLHLGADQLACSAERRELAELDFRAGLKAKSASAFGAALVYLVRGIALLPWEQWPSRREQVFQLHKEAAECAYLSGDSGLAEALARTALEHAGSRLEKVDLYVLQVLARLVKSDLPEALRWGLEGLRLFGLEVPERELPQALAAELAEVDGNLRGRAVEELLDAPWMEEPERLACVLLLSELVTAAIQADPTLFAFLNTRALNLTLKHGNSPWAPVVYACHGMMLAMRGGDLATGHDFVQLAVALARRMGDARQECRTLIALVLHLNHWRAPLRTGLPLLRRSLAAGIASGDLQFAAYALSTSVSTELTLGTELNRVLGSIDACLSFIRKTGVKVVSDAAILCRQTIRALQGRTREPARFDDDDFDEQAFLGSSRLGPMTRFQHAQLRLQVACVLGDLDEALRMSEVAASLYASSRGVFRTVEFHFHTALALAARGGADAPAHIEPHRRRLGEWAEGCPANFRHKHQLLGAEVARLQARPLEAMALYDEAIEGARNEGFLQDEALANERAGRFYLSLGRRRFAALHLRAAQEAQARWGASAKVALLEEEFPDLKPVGARGWTESASAPDGATPPGASLDLLSLLKASQTLTGEVVLDRLLEKLMAVCLEAAGATRGALVLDEDGTLMVRAVGSILEPVSLERTALASSAQVPATVVEHAWRTGDTLVLADAAHQGRFVTDPFVARRRVKSALAVPIQRHAKTAGVLYLENDLATRAFTPERVGVLRTLSTQIAISLENSQLFEQLKVEAQERGRAEQAVRFLAEAGLTLAESLDLEQTLAKATRAVVPFLADWCMFVLLEDGRLRPVAAAHADPAREDILRTLMEKHPPDWSLPPALGQALRTGQPVLHSHITDAMIAGDGQPPDQVEMVRAVGLKRAMHVPLIARGKTLGVILFASATLGRRYGQAELDLALELARRAAICIDNARLYSESQNAIRLRDDFLSVASHELNTPLTSLRLMAQGLLRRASRDLCESEPACRALRTIDQQTQRLARLIEEMLDVSRLQAGRLELQLEQVDLAAVIHRVAEQLQEPLARSGSELVLRVPDTLPGRWDAHRLEQVLLHLLSNAIKFGTGRPIELEAGMDGESAWLYIRDHGIGIAPDRLPHVFERFERAVSVRSYGGLGLGLHLVRAILTALGGTVRVESTMGAGTIVYVSLPCAGPAPECPPPPESAQDPRPS